MNDLEVLDERNAAIAARFRHGDLPIKPARDTVILSCFDARIDPVHLFGLEPGEVVVLRNVGGRVTEGVERDLAIIWAMAGLLSGGRAPQASLAIVHHADCGLERVAAPPIEEAIHKRSGLPRASLSALAIHDHVDAFADDLQRLRDSAIVPRGLQVSCHLYDPKSGRAEQIGAPVVVSDGEGRS